MNRVSFELIDKVEISPELQAAVVTLVRQELEQQLTMRRENRSTYQEICKDFAEEMEQYNGENRGGAGSRRWCYRVKDGIGALLRAMYHVDYVVKLPASAEPEMRAFVRGVLDLMEQYAPPRAADNELKERGNT